MNIFFLHLSVSQSAKYYFNKHCIKIILEIAQMLYTSHWILQSGTDWIDTHLQILSLQPYKKTHQNHPTTKWVRSHINNYMYACKLGLELCYEYTRRYKKVHKTQVRLEWLLENPPKIFINEKIDAYLANKNIPDGCTPIPLAMPKVYHSNDVIYSYRLYYLKDKRDIAQSTEVLQKLSIEWNMESEI